MTTIKVYSTPSCVYCNLLKDFLNENSVDFEAIDVADDVAAREYIVEKSGQMGVPVIEIFTEGQSESDVMVGFDESVLAAKLGL